jgi:hypothetical protein
MLSSEKTGARPAKSASLRQKAQKATIEKPYRKRARRARTNREQTSPGLITRMVLWRRGFQAAAVLRSARKL